MIDFKAFTKYSKPGPRYTSYPTAIEFNTNFKYEDYINILSKQNRSLSLYFHLPFCKSACYFCGCSVIYTTKEEKKERYLNYIFKELDLLKNIINTKRQVVQIHFGGGTPTYFSATQLEKLIHKIKDIFKNFSPDAELSCEIDPRFLNKEQAKILIQNGFNRISFGVQDFDEKVQKAINRIQSFETTQNAVDMIRAHGVKSINIDLIYGLPFQNLKTFKQTLQKALLINPDRFAIFNYAYVPWIKKNMRRIDEKSIPSIDTKLIILELCEKFLTQNGYKMIGMDHFAKPDDELFKALADGSLHRNFQGYTTKGQADLLGIGLTSIGEGLNHYAQNYKDMSNYEKAINNGYLPFEKGIILNNDDMIRKTVIMDLMANFSLDINKIENNFNICFKEYFKDELEKIQEYKEFINIDNNKIQINETGILLIRNIAMCFDFYMNKIDKNKQIFSKTV